MKILIAEDEEISREMLQEHLKQMGHDVLAASDGAEAWKILEVEDISLVITDWIMPRLDGIELTRRIRSKANSSYVYIILLTTKGEKKNVVKGIMEGADDYLAKPYDRDELRVRVQAGERVVQLEQGLLAHNTELEAARREVERANQRMKRDLVAAAKIQRSLLPSTQPGNSAVDLAWIFRPCDELGGDIFNVFQLGQNYVGFYLLDVVGHGVPAALLSVTLSRLLSPSPSGSGALLSSPTSGHQPISPSELAAQLNQRFALDEVNDESFTILFCILDLETHELHSVSAGHPGLCYVPAVGNACILHTDANGLPIGVIGDAEYETQRLKLTPGDRIVLYSDGLLDAQNLAGEYFGKRGLLNCVEEKHASSRKCATALEERVLSWCDGKRPDDDISVLVLDVSKSKDV